MSGIPLAKLVPLRRFRLGAEELIEMGDARRGAAARPDRRPFLGGRARASLGAEELIEMGQAAPAPASNVGPMVAMGLLVVGVGAAALLL